MDSIQHRALRALSKTGKQRSRLRGQLDIVNGALYEQVRAADALKVPRREIARAAEISPQTVYTILGKGVS